MENNVRANNYSPSQPHKYYKVFIWLYF